MARRRNPTRSTRNNRNPRSSAIKKRSQIKISKTYSLSSDEDELALIQKLEGKSFKKKSEPRNRRRKFVKKPRRRYSSSESSEHSEIESEHSNDSTSAHADSEMSGSENTNIESPLALNPGFKFSVKENNLMVYI
eukprot:TRINITY_DN1327_c0_g1_i3.p1 TRINITY_DN1327_c0_g1~~TRINITY_DN1327_c0_g1_i3.p1  ORF type:complete len:135 (-),score=29.56 TRINITY_DN1327_c0_g1_i3:622-1026(-)